VTTGDAPATYGITETRLTAFTEMVEPLAVPPADVPGLQILSSPAWTLSIEVIHGEAQLVPLGVVHQRLHFVRCVIPHQGSVWHRLARTLERDLQGGTVVSSKMRSLRGTHVWLSKLSKLVLLYVTYSSSPGYRLFARYNRVPSALIA